MTGMNTRLVTRAELPYGIISFFLPLALILGLSACVSAPKPISVESESAAVTILPVEEIKALYGLTYEVNPYLEPVNFIMTKKDEFVVLRFIVRSPVKGDVRISASLIGADGQQLADAKDIGSMQRFWDLVGGVDVTKVEKRKSNLARSYLYSNPLHMKAGETSFLLVLIGKPPIPRPSTVIATVTFPSGEASAFELPLPELPYTK